MENSPGQRRLVFKLTEHFRVEEKATIFKFELGGWLWCGPGTVHLGVLTVSARCQRVLSILQASTSFRKDESSQPQTAGSQL